MKIQRFQYRKTFSIEFRD